VSDAGDRVGGVPEEKSQSRSTQVLLFIAGIAAILLIVLNSQDVKIKFLFSTTTAPLIFVLIIAVLLGMIIGFILGRYRDHGYKRND
jgi:uncharacterized integral membrane protein